MKHIRLYLIVLAVNIFVAYAIYIALPDARDALLMEDRLVENATTVLFFVSFVVGLVGFFKATEYRKTILAIGLLGLLGALDELSFGERMFELKMPSLFGIQIDGAHDFFYLIARLIDELPRIQAVIIILSGMVLFAGILWKFGPAMSKKLQEVYGLPTVIFVLLFCGQLGLALVIDLEVIRHDLLFVLEEQLEMNSAMLLTFWCLSLCVSGKSNRSQKCDAVNMESPDLE